MKTNPSTEPFYAELGARLKCAREMASVTQDELASHLGVSQISISSYESGRRRIPIHLLCRAAQHLKISSGALLPDALA